jgi:hypothetical protein
MTPKTRKGGLNVDPQYSKKLVTDQSFFAMVARLDQKKSFYSGTEMLRGGGSGAPG